MEALAMAAKQVAMPASPACGFMHLDNCVAQSWRRLERFEELPFTAFHVDNQRVGFGLLNQRLEALRRQPDRRAARQNRATTTPRMMAVG